MPLSINVGLSRKASKDYQSTGYSINVNAELDQALLAKPDELQRQIDDLYNQAKDAIDRQAGVPENNRPASRSGNGNSSNGSGNGYAGRSNGNGRYSRNGNGHAAGPRSNGNGGSMTESQRRAILAITKRANIDPEAESMDIIGVGFDDLSLRQASELIDHLKGTEPANGR